MIRAVMGGSFDPVHNGHVALVHRVLSDDLADHVHVIPAARSPHKSDCLATSAHRLAMVHLAFAETARVTVEDLEVLRAGPSFTVDTLEALARRYPEDELRLLCGADNLAGLADWHRPERLLDLAELVVFARPAEGTPPQSAEGPDGRRVHRVDDFHHEVSSTGIRAMLAAGKPVDTLVPPQVAAYIGTHRLYRT